MSIILRRPYLIDESSCTAHLPSPNLETDTEPANIPSPVVWQLLKYRAAQITVEIASLKAKTDTAAVSALLRKLHSILNAVPIPFKFNHSSASLVDQPPLLSFAQHKILLDIYVSTFMLLKPFLLVDSSASEPPDSSQENNRYRIMACDYGILQIELTTRMEGLFSPERAKDHQVAFTPFDTAMTLCIALQKDTEKCFLPRSSIIVAIGAALCTLSRMESFSTVARQGARVLRDLVTSLALTQQEKDLILVDSTQRRDLRYEFTPKDLGEIPNSDSFELPNNIFQTIDAQAIDLSVDLSTVDGDDSFQNENVDLFAHPLDFEWRDNIDLGLLDQVFHWDDLAV